MTALSVRGLVDELAGAGWGTLRGAEYHGVQAVLRALAASSGADRVVVATAHQIADRTSYSYRHVRRCLHLLETRGVVVWVRGHIESGRPKPGWFRLRRSVLTGLVAHARQLHRDRLTQRRAETGHRIRTTIRKATLWPRRRGRLPLSIHADMASTLPLQEGEWGADQAAPPHSREDDMKIPCIHGTPDTNGCGMCHMARRRGGLDFDVRSLHAPKEKQQQGNAKAWREVCRAAARQAPHTQPPLTGEDQL